MTPVQQHAMALARGGHWQLLDALELAARAHEPDLGGMLHAVGSQPILGYLTEEELDWEFEWEIPDPVRAHPGNCGTWRTLTGELVEPNLSASRGLHRSWLPAIEAQAMARDYASLVQWLADHAPESGEVLGE